MKTYKISSTFTLKEISIKTEELKKSIQRISSGKIRNADSPTGIYLSSLLKDKIEKLDFISQHITKNVNILQNYEEVLNSTISAIEDMKIIVERATQVSNPNEFKELEKAYTERFLALKENIRKTRFFGKSIASGGFSNAITKIQITSGSTELNPPDINVSGINFRKYGIKEFEEFQIKIEKSGNTVQATIEVNGSPVATETKELTTINFPITVDFQEIGLSIKLNSGNDFSATVNVKADGILLIFGEGQNDFEKFFLPSLEPEFLGLSEDLSEGAEVNLGRIKNALKNLSEIRGKIGEKIYKLQQRTDMNSMIQAKHKILGSNLSETDMPSEATILSLKQTILQADTTLLQRTISNLQQVLAIMMRR